MAISVDTVYKTVLLILNNEQRGYMTPDEFNKTATQVQRKIFERYFEDLNQQVRIPQSDMEYSDRIAITDEKIAEFKTEKEIAWTSNTFALPEDLYRLGSITYEKNTPFGSLRSLPVEMQRVGRAELYNIRKSPLTTPTIKNPIYIYENNTITFFPELEINPSINPVFLDKIKVQYLKKPSDIRWGYKVGELGQYIFTDFNFVKGAFNLGEISSITDQVDNTGLADLNQSISIASTSDDGTGTDGSEALFSYEINNSNEVTSIQVLASGSGYKEGDVLTFTVPGSSGHSFTLTISASDLISNTTQGKTDFELHNSEQTEVILNILSYSGIIIRDPSIVQVAAQKIQQEEVNEKS
tara:strand:- start:62 stop:1123 length:1062 start_codon:yes stop_codon:yes gene_type:complete